MKLTTVAAANPSGSPLPRPVWQLIAIHMGKRKALKLRLLSRGMREIMASCSQFWKRFYPLDSSCEYNGPMHGYHDALMHCAWTAMLEDARSYVSRERSTLAQIRAKIKTRHEMIEHCHQKIVQCECELDELKPRVVLQEALYHSETLDRDKARRWASEYKRRKL